MAYPLLLLIAARRQSPQTRRGFITPLLIPVVTFLFLHFVGTGWVFGARFQLSKGRYEAAVAQIKAAPPAQRDAVAGRDCVVDPGPPLRVAFIQPGGILDNYTAIVYDPTGSVMKANQFKKDWSNWENPGLAPVKGLFGGDLLWAEPLGGSWYRCGFT